jgi:tRNA pseudouridine55 synthase
VTDSRRDYILLCDKPAGRTSHDVVAAVRRALPDRTKVGHAGTLDPFATGLLLVLVGRATRVQRFLMALPKRYEAVARFGATSSTGDPEGEIVTTGRVPAGDLDLPVGRLRQRPPAFSAVKVQGRRAYELARAGTPVTLAERDVEVHRFEERWRDGDRRAFVIECSSGTYVRSLIAGLGDAYCEQLRRTRIGGFDVADADPQRPVALAEALDFLPSVPLAGEAAVRAGHGGSVSASGPGGSGTVRLTDDDGLIALAAPHPDGSGRLKVVVGLR